MRVRTLIALALLALGLAAYLRVTDRQRQATAEQERRRDRLLPELDRERLVGLHLSAPGRPALRIERRDQREWWLREPVRAPTDGAAMARLLAALELTEVWQRLDPDVSRAQRGLDPPRLRLTLLQRGAAPQQLSIGGPDASGLGVYVAVESALAVVASSFAESVELDADALRERDLVPWLPAETASLAIAAAGTPSLRLERRPRGLAVALGAGPLLRADPLAAERLIGAIGALRIQRFSPRPSGAAPWRVTLRARGGAVALELGFGCPEDAARRWVGRQVEGVASGGCVDADELQPLTRGFESLVDLAPLRSEEPELERIVITRGRRTLMLVREGASWRLGAGGPPADGDALRAWVAALAGWRGELELLADAAAVQARLGGVATTLRFERAQAGDAELLRVGAADARGRWPVQRGDEAALLWLPAAAAALLGEAALDLRERVVLRLAAEGLRRIVVTGPALRETLERQDGEWRVRAAQPGVALSAVDHALVAALLERLAALRIARWLPAWPGSTQALAVVTIWSDAPQPVARLELARDAEGRCLGRGPGASPFVLDEADCRLLLASKARRAEAVEEPAEGT